MTTTGWEPFYIIFKKYHIQNKSSKELREKKLTLLETERLRQGNAEMPDDATKMKNKTKESIPKEKIKEKRQRISKLKSKVVDPLHYQISKKVRSPKLASSPRIKKKAVSDATNGTINTREDGKKNTNKSKTLDAAEEPKIPKENGANKGMIELRKKEKEAINKKTPTTKEKLKIQTKDESIQDNRVKPTQQESPRIISVQEATSDEKSKVDIKKQEKTSSTKTAEKQKKTSTTTKNNPIDTEKAEINNSDKMSTTHRNKAPQNLQTNATKTNKKVVNTTEINKSSPSTRRSAASVKSVGTNTDKCSLLPGKSIEMVSVATDTEDLAERQTKVDDNNHLTTVTKKFLVSHSNKKSNWTAPEALVNGIVPLTPEGPRFRQDGTQLTYTLPGVQNDILQNLHALQMRGEMCDVLIKVENIDFKAHKIVLAAACPYFATLFKNIRTVRIDRLILEGLTAQSVAAMLGYFYMAKLIIDVEDVEELLEAAYYFQTTEVVKLCTDYLEVNLGIHNCFNFYKLAEKHDIQGLRLKTFRYICWNFKSIVKLQRFLEVDADILIKIISSNSVKVKAEEEVYSAVWEWYRYNTEDRKYHLPKICIHIHFEVMDVKFLDDRVKKEMFLESELCRKKVIDALNMINNKVDVENRKLDKFRQASDNIYIFNSSSTTCQMLDLMTCKTQNIPELNLTLTCVDQDYHVTIKAGKHMYALSKSKVAYFNASNLNWEHFSDGIPVFDTGICSTKTSIYVVGGKPNGKQLWELNLSTKKWINLPEMEFDRRSPAVAVMGNTKPKIFVAGGFSLSKSTVLDNMELYSAADKTWKTVKEKMSVPRLQATMIVHADKVYVVGGRSMEMTLNSVEVYDRSSQKWTTTRGNLSEPKTESALVVFEGKIYSIGGKGCSSVDVLEEIGKARKWNLVGKLDKLPVGMQCIVYKPV